MHPTCYKSHNVGCSVKRMLYHLPSTYGRQTAYKKFRPNPVCRSQNESAYIRTQITRIREHWDPIFVFVLICHMPRIYCTIYVNSWTRCDH